jgi:hypothetical protein
MKFPLENLRGELYIEFILEQVGLTRTSGLVSVCFVTEHCKLAYQPRGREVGSTDMHFGGPRFESRLGDKLL